MNRKTFMINRIIAVMLLAGVFSFAFVWSNPSASEQLNGGVQEQNTIADTQEQKTITVSETTQTNADAEISEAVTLRAGKRGSPLINLQDGKRLRTKFVGTENEAQSFIAGQTEPLTMTNADLNADGAADLIVGYAGSNGGHLALYQGNLDSLSARTPQIFEDMRSGNFPEPFLPDARLISLPVAPDFVGTGDFNRDGYKDIIAAQRGDNRAFLLVGSGRGGYRLSYVELAGRITTMLTENIDPLDNAADVAFAVSGDTGASLLIYNNATDAFGSAPEVYPLSAEATSLAIGQLDDSAPMDILAAGNGKVAIIHGAYPENTDSRTEQSEALRSGQVESLTEGFNVSAVRVGNFVWDRENRPEIALLSGDGSIRILERGKLDKRPFTESENKSRIFKHRELMNQEEEIRNLDYQPRTSKPRREKWIESDRIQTSAVESDRASSATFFTSARMTPLGVEDLLVLDSASRKIHVLVSNHEELKAKGESLELSSSGKRAAITLDVEGTPAVVMPMKLSVMNRPGIVMLDKGSREISYSLAVPEANFNVNTTADTYDGVCDANCSFRDALDDANANMNSDMIILPAGTYTISPALGGPDQDTVIDPAAQGSGDWDVFFDLTITGAGQATTILEAAAAQPGHDRVLDVLQTGVGIPDLTISGVTIRNGRCRADFPCVDGGGVRYAVDNLTVLTVTDSTITNNRTEVSNANPANNGGGIFGGQSDFVFTNVTVTNNTTAFVASGCTGATLCGGEGGGIFASIRFTSNPTSVTITNSTFTGNTANSVNGLGGRGGAYAGSPDSLSITGGTFNNNVAFTDAGAFRLFTPTTISGSTISNNTARQSGGGIWSDPLANDNTPQTNTFTNLTMKGNTADSDGVIGTGNVVRGDGGAIFHGRGTLNLNNPTIGGTGVGEANTAFDGGGIARTYSHFQAAVFNASTLNINSGGSIVGNQAINNGGGIVNDATKTAAAGNASVLNMTGATAVTFTNNKARNHGGGIAVITGGGSTTPAATATLNNMTLRSNQANSDLSGGGDGGALYQGSVVTGGGTTFTGTLTIGGSGFANSAVNGGGIRNNAGTVTIPSNVNITHNTATGTGGGISNAGTLSALTNATITNNMASGNGGGIHNTGTLGILANPALNFNSGATGGGLFSSNGALTINGGTVNGNTATTGKGGGVEHGGTSASAITGSSVLNNTGSGVHVTGTGSLDVKTSTITGNSGDGITKIGTGVGSHFDSNVVHTNGELGIDLSDNGVTPNDANDVDTGPNNLQNFPVINWVRRGDGIGNVTLNSPNGKYRIQYYANTTCDASGHGEGEVLLTSQVVDIISGNTLTFATPALAYGTREQITATATHDVNGNSNFDDDGNTSEFSACRKVNTLPTFTAVQTPSRQQGSPATNSQIATVTDPDEALNNLVVTVKAVGAMGAGGASATVNGVTISNIVVDSMGNVTADIVASCTATDASFTLRVTDTPGEFNETTLNVTVTPNTPPTVGNYPNTTVNLGSGTTVTPDAAPTDNGTVATLTASAPGFTGTFSGNTTTGVITVTSAGPSGTYTVTVTATDNCGATTTTTFQLLVNAPPTITGATISRQQGSPASNSQIATVNDLEDAENTLVVTVNGGASATVNGVTVSNIVVDSMGNVTADVVASCTATNATFTLSVTDSNGASNTATLTVNVTPNTPPSVGTYSTTSVNASSGTTVTPSAAPAENGSIVSATVMASAGFTGTLSVDQTTGVVTVTNANPVGSYTVTVTYTDNCGATTMPTFTLNVIDVTPPDTTITANPTDPSGPNVSFSFTGTDAESGVASFECDLDGGGFTACTSPKTYMGLTQGSHTFQVRAIDNAMNVDPTPASFTWNVDATPPDTTINSSPPNPSNSGNASFTFSGTDTGGSTVASFECQLDGGGFAACTSPQNYTGLSDGSHTFQVRAIDGVGNVDATPASYTWTVDATAPDTSITANPTNPSGSNVSFSFTGTDTGGTGVASFECDLDGGGFTACTSPQAYNGLADGSHTFQVRAIDNAGNVDGSPASFTWIVDTMPPDTTITVNPSDPSGANVSFSFTGSDAGSGVASFECDLDGGGFAACTSPQSYTNLSQGSHTFMVRAIDNVGNVDPTPASFTWNVDATAPDTTINSNPTDPSNSGNASFTFSGTDTGGSTVASFECDLDGGGFTACTSPQNYTGLSDGSHTFMVRAIDGVGNVDATPASYTWTVDTTGPDTTITANPTDPSNSNSASFSFTGTDTGGSGVASFECQLDGGGFAACTSPQTYNSLSDGSHTFEVRAIDNAGNADATPATFTWTVDTAPPDTTINSNPTNPTNSTSASFTFSGTDSGTGVASFECQLDGGGFAACTSPKNYVGLSPGSHTFQVRAIDGIGNVDPTPASFTWTIDTTAPSVTINQAAGQSDPANGMGITIHFTAVFSEPVTGFTNSDVMVGGTAGATTVVVTEIGPMNGTTFDVAVSGMTMGGTVTASIPANRAQDAAGNQNTASTSTDNTVTYVPNTPPTANPDSYSTVQDTPLTVAAPGVLGNDSDPDAGNTITAVLVSGPTNAQSFSLNADGSFNYTPNPGFTGTDSFTYKAKDNFNAESNTVTVTLNVQFKFSWFSYSGLLFNEQALNQVTAGSDVPVRFTLYGYKGNPYSQPPTSQQINCATFAPIGAATTINRYMPDPFYSSLYDFYQTTWQTQASWKFTCRRLTLHLTDGTTKSLNFYFK